MAFDRFLIAPINSGLQSDLKPFLIPDDAFALLQNAVVFRGRVVKRFGSVFIGSVANQPNSSRLRIALTGGAGVGITSGVGAATGTVPGIKFKAGQAFSIGNEFFTVQALGVPVVMLATGASVTHTFNTTTGVYAFTGADINTQVYFYPAEPVMGLTILESGATNNQPSYGFDTQFAYVFVGGQWQRSATGATPVWRGSNLNFFWTANYIAAPGVIALFVSNFFAVNPNGAVSANDDPIWYLNASTGAWASITPITLTAGNKILTALIILPFKDRLLLLNTIEVNAAGTVNTNFKNRCRFSSVGDPTNVNAFLEITQVGALGAGVINASTDEAIVSAEFIKDRLIVYFERSTWELAFTNNDIVPFNWQKLNTELGSESTFSSVPFDSEILTISNTGVNSCNGSNVVRIDTKIPDKIFEISNSNQAINRTTGIREYLSEMVFWSYVSDNFTGTYPNKVLVYNYRNQTWAENDDCITAFGYYEQQGGTTWASSGSAIWSSSGSVWNSGYLNALERLVIAGNQQGFTFAIIPDGVGRNAPAMQISNITLAGTVLTLTIVDHSLTPSNIPEVGDYISIELAQGSINLNGLIFPVNRIPTANTVELVYNGTLGGVYTGGGLAARVSNIKILSKQWNPYDGKDRNVYLAKINFGVLRTSSGQILVDYYPSSSQLSMIEEGQATGSIMGTGVLETFPYNPAIYPFEQEQDRLWHSIYFQTSGECIQIFMHMNDTQMRNSTIAWENFELQGLILYTQATSDRMQ